MRVNVALMDDATIDDDQLLRLLDNKMLRQAIENARVLFASLGGTLPNAPSVAPIARGGRFFANANRILQASVQMRNAHALERDSLAKTFSDLLAALSFAQSIARQVCNGASLRNKMLIAQRIRSTAEFFRAFRLQAWLNLSPIDV
jgi:hypothetical protein